MRLFGSDGVAVIINNQLMIPEGRYHCPVHECEERNKDGIDVQLGYGKKALAFSLLRLHYRVRVGEEI